jgi:site-specific DNA recombinase
MRVALYARYSSDQQRAASIEDQFRVCREAATARGWTVAGEFCDAAVSGSSLFRSGILALIAAARAGQCDVILAEALDRFSRSMKDTAELYEQMRFAGVQIVTLADGEINELHVGLKGTMNALYLKDLAEKTIRGMWAVAMSGRIAGGLSYGYTAVPGDVRGKREIHPGEADIIRRVFELYAMGESPKAIAKRLNADGIPGPRSRAWAPSTINGHASRGTGLLNNELYVGRLVWKRLAFRKDPNTGRRISRVNLGTRANVDVPELRIVEQLIWDAVKARQAELRKVHRPERARRPRHLFSGLTVCGVCGGGYTLQHTNRLSCFNATSRGTCTNRTAIRRDELESRVLVALETKMLDPGRFERFCAGWAAKWAALNREHQTAVVAVRQELGAVERRINGLVEAIADGFRDEAIRSSLAALQARRDELQQQAAAETPKAIQPDLALRYRARVAELVAAFHRGELGAKEALRAYVRKVVIPGDKSSPLALVGRVQTMLSGDNGGIPPPQPSLTQSKHNQIELPDELWIVAA